MPNAPVLARETIASLREIDALTTDDELLLEVIDDFLLYSTDLVDAIKVAAQDPADGALASQSHSLKGASLNLGALALFEVCDTIERLAREQQLSTIEEQLSALYTAYEKTTVALIELRNRTRRGETIDDLLG